MKRFILFFPILFLFVSCDKSSSEAENLEHYFNQVWEDFDKTYSYFELKGVDWDQVKSKYEDQIISDETDSGQLKDVLVNMIMELKDYHVRLIINDEVYRYSEKPAYHRNSPENALNYLSVIHTNNNSISYGEIKDSNIAYLRFKNLNSDGDYSILQKFFEELTTKNGFILDLRDNYGGNEKIARNFASKLISEELVYGYIRYRSGADRNEFGNWFERKIVPNTTISYSKPIMVLVNRGVVSSGEGFTAIMRELPNAKLIGDTTLGSTANPKEFTLPNGWKYYVSSWQAVLTNYQMIEDKGIAPDILVTNSEQSIQEGKDLILEEAIDLLNE